MNPIFGATIKKGKVIFHNLDLFNGYLISLENKEVDVIVRKKKKHRSNPQNAYMWAVCYRLLSETTGYTDDEIHASMKAMFLMDRTGKFPVVRSTTSLTTTAMEDYLEKIRRWATQELNCIIPLPNEVELEPDKPQPEPTAKEIKTHQEEVKEDNRKVKLTPVNERTLDELFNWVGKGKITGAWIIDKSIEKFGREPRKLMQWEAEELDTLIVAELPMGDI